MLQKLSHEASTLLTVLLTCQYVLSNTTGVHIFWAIIEVYLTAEDHQEFSFGHILKLDFCSIMFVKIYV
jgi:hypothetical protein